MKISGDNGVYSRSQRKEKVNDINESNKLNDKNSTFYNKKSTIKQKVFLSDEQLKQTIYETITAFLKDRIAEDD